jgi:hypothetical protein
MVRSTVPPAPSGGWRYSLFRGGHFPCGLTALKCVLRWVAAEGGGGGGESTPVSRWAAQRVEHAMEVCELAEGCE